MDWKAVLKTVAPWMGTALGGPLGGMAGKAIADALGVPEATQDKLRAAIAGATPEQLLALKRADHDFQAQMQQMGFEHLEHIEGLAAQDRDSARRREMEVQDWTPRVLAYITVIGWLICNFLMLSRPPEKEVEWIVMRMMATLDVVLGMVIAYYFGSSVGSARKTEILAKGGGNGSS